MIKIMTPGFPEIEDEEKVEWDYAQDFERGDAFASIRVKFLGNAGILISARFWGYYRPNVADIYFGTREEIKKALKEELKRLKKLGFTEVS